MSSSTSKVAAAIFNDKISTQDQEHIHWDDNYFKTQLMENNKLTGHISFQQAREYAKAFLNWYVSGKGASKLLDIWIGLVGGMFIPTGSILCQHLLADTMFNGTNSNAIRLDPICNVNKLNINEFKYANLGSEFDSNETKIWYSRIFNMLEENELTNSVSPTIITAINYLGYIAMSLFKLLVKDAPKISQFIVKYVTNEFNGFWHSPGTLRSSGAIKIRTPPPHKFAIQQFEHTFQKGSDKCKTALTLIVATYAFTNPLHKEIVQKILKTACLDYLDLYGMGCLNWLQKAAESCNITPKVLMDYMATDKNRTTNAAMQNLFRNYINPGKFQFTWRWSRLFFDKAFSDISTSCNPLYAATLAALSCRCDVNSSVWNITQFRKDSLKKEAIATARTILKVKKNETENKLM